LTKTFDDVRLLNGEELQRDPAMQTVKTDFDLVEADTVAQLLQDLRAMAATEANSSDALLRKSIDKHTQSDFADEPVEDERAAI
jgi:hypothetical protein